MRAIVVRPGPHFSVQDVCAGWTRALRRLGVKVFDFNYDDRLSFYENAHHKRDGEFVRSVPEPQDAIKMALKGLSAVAYEWWPDLIFVVSGFYISADYWQVLRSRGHRIVLLHTESPYEDDRQLEVAPLVDVNLINDPTNLDRFRAVNRNTFYMPHAYDPGVHRPDGMRTDPHDFGFVGTGFAERCDFFERVDWTGIDVALAGNWQKHPTWLTKYLAHPADQCVDNSEAVRLYRSVKASANLYRREAERPGLVDGWAMGPREVELAATGCFYLTEPRGENREVLPMVPTFSDPDDFGERLRWWLAHDDERAKVAAEARAAIAPRTFENHARTLLAEVMA